MTGKRNPSVRPPTLDDVAERAGISRATVSRVLNGGVRSANSISDDVRERILQAAQELNYRPNVSAQAMVAGASRTIAILIARIDDVGASAMVAGASRRARELGYAVVVLLAGSTSAEEIDAVRAARSLRTRALIVAVTRTTDAAREATFADELRAFAAEGGRVSVIGDNVFDFDEVVLQNALSAGHLAEDLLSLGYRRFAVVRGPAGNITPSERTRGFVSALQSAGIHVPDEHIATGQFDRQGGYTAAADLLPHLDDIDVIFATSDGMALGVLHRLRGAGLHIPDDVAVAGFDDVPIATDLVPALTTVHAPLADLAERAVDQVLTDHPDRQRFELRASSALRASTPHR